MTTDVRIGAAFIALGDISKQFPTVEFHVRVKDGAFALGIPKGPAGDAAEAAWNAALPSLKVGMS